MNIFGEILKECRLSKKMSKRKFSKIIGCSPISITYYENGKRCPPLQKMIKIFKILDVPISRLFLSPPVPTCAPSPPCATEYQVEVTTKG